MTDVFSVTGQRIDLKEASDETLAEVLDGLEAERSIVKERIGVVTRELARRHGLKVVTAGDWSIRVAPYATAKRRDVA